MKSIRNGKKNRAIVISPHRDDAAISIGDYVYTHFREVFVFNIFSKSVGTILNIPEKAVDEIRKKEDLEFKKRYGFKFIDFGMPDTSLRGVKWNDYHAPVDKSILKEVRSKILSGIKEGDIPKTLFVPAAYGLHPDHYLCTLAFSGGELLDMLSRFDFRIYCDQQYYHEGKAFHKGHDYLAKNGVLCSHKFDYKGKRDMISIYKSQLSPQRIDLLTKTIQKEYYWISNANFFCRE